MAHLAWRRLGRSGRFRYVDAKGNRITDPEQLARIDELTIPPAWRDVCIAPTPGAKLQATGYDAAGRKQYLYNDEQFNLLSNYENSEYTAELEKLRGIAYAE